MLCSSWTAFDLTVYISNFTLEAPLFLCHRALKERKAFSDLTVFSFWVNIVPGKMFYLIRDLVLTAKMVVVLWGEQITNILASTFLKKCLFCKVPNSEYRNFTRDHILVFSHTVNALRSHMPCITGLQGLVLISWNLVFGPVLAWWWLHMKK